MEGQPEPLVEGGKYIRFNNSVKAWGWMVMWAGYITVPAEVAADPSSYDLRFEICTGAKFPISAQARIILGDYGWYPSKGGIPVNTYGSGCPSNVPSHKKSFGASGNWLECVKAPLPGQLLKSKS